MTWYTKITGLSLKQRLVKTWFLAVGIAVSWMALGVLLRHVNLLVLKLLWGAMLIPLAPLLFLPGVSFSDNALGLGNTLNMLFLPVLVGLVWAYGFVGPIVQRITGEEETIFMPALFGAYCIFALIIGLLFVAV